LQFLLDGLGQIIGNKVLDHRTLVIHDAIDAEVQIGQVELEQFAQ